MHFTEKPNQEKKDVEGRTPATKRAEEKPTTQTQARDTNPMDAVYDSIRHLMLTRRGAVSGECVIEDTHLPAEVVAEAVVEWEGYGVIQFDESGNAFIPDMFLLEDVH